MTKSLMIHEEDGEQLVDAYHLALFLGYAQQHLLRKQVLTDWSDIFEEGVDFKMLHDEAALRRYEAFHEERGFGKLRAIKPARGRLLFTATGLQKVLHHTSKDIDLLEEELRRAGVLEGGAGKSARALRALEGSSSSSVADQLPPNDPGERSTSLEMRKWEYGVLERLLEHLRVLADPHLQKLAITSAETALGRELLELRAGLESSRAHAALSSLLTVAAATPSPPISRADGPFQERPGVFYTLSEIGAKAGGFSARAAGAAANLVAERRGHSPAAIRSDELGFNRVYERDDATGHPRRMCSFDSTFANEVVLELQSNPQFAPQPFSTGPDPSAEFGRSDRRYPILSRGPFEDDDQPASNSS